MSNARVIIENLLEYAVKHAEQEEEPSLGGCWEAIQAGRAYLRDTSEPHVVGDYKDQARQRAQSVAKALMAGVNEMNFDTAAFAKTICSEHRTLQQNAMRAFAACIRTWAKQTETGDFDMRNERTVNASAAIVERVDMEFFPFI